MSWQIDNFVGSLPVDGAIALDDQMHHDGADAHYFYVGMSDLLVVLNTLNIRSCYADGNREVERILDFGCGHGRVTRWLRAAFPEAQISIADLNDSGIRWCAERYS